MKTMYTAAIYLICTLGTYAQGNKSLPITPHPNYVSQLVNEINAINTKAARLRLEAQSVEPVTKTEMLLEAIRLEKKSMTKQIEAAEINLAVNANLYEQNSIYIKKMQSRSSSKEHEMHVKFLLNDAARNEKQAIELAEESKAQTKPELKLASLENAQEEILLALKQQNEVISHLDKSGAKIAHSGK